MATNTAVTSTTPSILSSPNEKGPYSIGFVYVNQSDVEVYVNGVKKSITTDYTFSSATQITFVANPTVSIEFRRNSDLSTRSVDFNDGSVLTESDLDSNTNQILYAQQEIINDFATKTGTETLTNKTLTTPDINTPDIDGGTIDGATISSCTINNDVTGNLTGNVTGNVTGAVTGNASTATTAGTVTTAAQTNITSVGTLTGLTVSGNSAFNDHIDLPDNKEIHLGGSDEARIYFKPMFGLQIDGKSDQVAITSTLSNRLTTSHTSGGGENYINIGNSIANTDAIKFKGHIRAADNDSYDIGATGGAFKDLYLSGNITVGGTVDGKDVSTLGAAGTLTGNTLASGVTASSLTSVGTLTALTVGGATSLTEDITITEDKKIIFAKTGSSANVEIYNTGVQFRIHSDENVELEYEDFLYINERLDASTTKKRFGLTSTGAELYGDPQSTDTNNLVLATSGYSNDSTVGTRKVDITGALDVDGNITVGGDIVTTSNGDIELDPNGSGKVIFKGNATKGAGQFVLNCENNSHGIVIKGPPHSAAASYTLTLPNDDGSANQVLKTDGSGVLSWVDQSGGGSYANSDVDSHLNISGASSGQILSWNGSDYAWVADQTTGSAGGANAIHMNDNVKITFGDTTTPDLEILHSGSEASIKNKTGNLTITNNYNTGVINLNPQEGRKGIMIADQGAVSLYYDAPASSPVAKFQTTSDGVYASEKVLIGHSSPIPVGSTANASLQTHASANGILASFTGYSSNSGGAHIVLGKSRGATGTPGTAVWSTGGGDNLGGIRFAGDDGDDVVTQAALIVANVDGTVASNQIPGELVFSTANSTGAMTAALTISSSQSATFAGAVSVASKTVSQTATAVAALEIDCATGNYFTKAISASSTFTFANVPASGTAYGFVLEVDVTGSSTAITWPAAVKWPGGTAPTLTDTKTHVFTFATVDGGTTWRASSLVDYTT